MPVIQTLSSLEFVGDVFYGGALEGRENQKTRVLRSQAHFTELTLSLRSFRVFVTLSQFALLLLRV